MQKDIIIFLRLLTVLLLISPFAQAANESMVSVEVIPLTQTVSPGQSFEIAVIFSMEPGWHTYWQNPGDAGIPSSFEWTLPPGFEVVKQQEPVPTRHIDEGITTFIHEEEAIYLFDIVAPKALPDTFGFSLKVNWLECKSICQAGASQHQFALPQDENTSYWKIIKNRALATYPLGAINGEWEAFVKRDRVELKSQSRQSKSAKLIGADFFPTAEMVFDTEKPVAVKRGFRHQSIHIPHLDNRNGDPQRLEGILVQQFATPAGDVFTNTSINQTILQ